MLVSSLLVVLFFAHFPHYSKKIFCSHLRAHCIGTVCAIYFAFRHSRRILDIVLSPAPVTQPWLWQCCAARRSNSAFHFIAFLFVSAAATIPTPAPAYFHYTRYYRNRDDEFFPSVRSYSREFLISSIKARKPSCIPPTFGNVEFNSKWWGWGLFEISKLCREFYSSVLMLPLLL